MRQVLRLLGTRYGIALVLLLLVAAIIGATRVINGPYRNGLLGGPAVGASHGSVDPHAGNDDDTAPGSSAAPVTSAGAAPPAEVATGFALAWLAHDGVPAEQWRSGLAPHATPALMAKLKETDPTAVPARRITGPVSLQSHGTALVDVAVPMDSGTLRLLLLGPDGRWLVDEANWEPRR